MRGQELPSIARGLLGGPGPSLCEPQWVHLFPEPQDRLPVGQNIKSLIEGDRLHLDVGHSGLDDDDGTSGLDRPVPAGCHAHDFAVVFDHLVGRDPKQALPISGPRTRSTSCWQPTCW